ncbi:MAG TPA: phosphoribosylformylglycinamidine synthase subunit PurL [Candidatus Marinimicrobia bacterium]|nr:MAG: phosphoribosylformylglycinamidine synthase II [Candidatus Marinimicrobia bacterium CG1_02_48_14]HCW75322.1 phosphoribosylformylglycinamidine synthase subunit PurL [Candidatus Neomarinimicrobiota bacterium]
MAFTNEILDFASQDATGLKKLLQDYRIALTPEEALKIQNEFLKRAPSLAEAILFSIEGSEHCSYKSSRPYLKQFITDGPHVILGAKEDAGIVAVTTDKTGARYGIVMSHESHNHPSQIVPYEGAATGIGGNVRDVACMGAEVIAVADGLRFGDINRPKTKWIQEGVVAGIAGYGNPIGVPNIAGDVYYDAGYNDNCLVTVVTLGTVRESDIIHSFAPKNADGHDLILIGKPTDNSGFGGASFASFELDEAEKDQNKGAVQEPNAFLKRHILKATYGLFELLKQNGDINRVGFKDLGAGGVACASVEMAETAGYGADVDIDAIHTSMPELHPSVILCAETQERFMWVSPPDLTPFILDHYNVTFDLPTISVGAKASKIGKIRADGQFVVRKGSTEIVNAPAVEVTKGFLYNRPVQKPKMSFSEPDFPEPTDYNAILLKILAHENVASREVIFETYDKTVQGRTTIEAGRGDAGLMQPFNSDDYPEEIRKTGIALTTDQNPSYGKIDPYWGGVNAVVESLRNVAAVGAKPEAITDCLCFGNPEKPEQMWAFVQGTLGVAEACKSFYLHHHMDTPLPIIAGNVSFYNESKGTAIPPSPIISCLGSMPDVGCAVDLSFKKPGNWVLMVGERKDECGGSIYYALQSELGENVPHPIISEVEREINSVTDAIQAGLVTSCHDISEGGIATALAEMTFHNGIGCSVLVPGDPRADKKLFGETGGFVLEVTPGNLAGVLEIFKHRDVVIHQIGKTSESGLLEIDNCIKISVTQARERWTNGLREKLA